MEVSVEAGILGLLENPFKHYMGIRLYGFS